MSVVQIAGRWREGSEKFNQNAFGRAQEMQENRWYLSSYGDFTSEGEIDLIIYWKSHFISFLEKGCP